MKKENNKTKEIHLRLPQDLVHDIESDKKAKTKNEAYKKVLYKGLKYNDILKEIQELRTEIKIVKTIDNYGIFLLEQIYSDLDFEKRDKNKSKNLIELKNEFQKISKKKNHSL